MGCTVSLQVSEPQKAKGAFVLRKRPSYFDGGKPNSVPEFLRGDDHLSHPDFSESPIKFWRWYTAATASWCDNTRGLAGRLPSLCFVLHRMGFFVPRELLRERWALTSPFHPCLHFVAKEPAVSFLWHSPSASTFANVARVFYAACCRMVFGLSSSKPKWLTSDHLPSTSNLA